MGSRNKSRNSETSTGEAKRNNSIIKY